MRIPRGFVVFAIGVGVVSPALPVRAEIPRPDDAPGPLSPEETVASYRLPDGFRLELLAAEPLIASPSGVCWGADGRMYVSELHGYNLEGELEIEALNAAGRLDLEVRRVQAADAFREAARAGTFGVVKVLRDTDGDGRMDAADVLARDLPPAYGLVPSHGGVIVACAPDIVFLADRDGDGEAEERRVLFTGFRTGALERGINAPTWGDDGWIHFGSGHGGGTITGPHLAEPVELPGSDFRIRPDGSAIEPVTGHTHTFGFAFTPAGDRFVISTTAPVIQVAPIPFPYLRRNPHAAAGGLQQDITPDRRAYPIAPPHPWRTKRAEHAGYFEYYRSRYGASDSDPSGWFTSACSPLIYRDRALPGLHGGILACDPAANFIFRGTLTESEDAGDPVFSAARWPAADTREEFGASSDPWSHPMALGHSPDGSVWVVDYYREIIEDYSAIPRHLQQQYGLYAGHDRGRIYRLTHGQIPKAPEPDLDAMSDAQLAEELAHPLLWRRQTVRRVLVERGASGAAEGIRETLSKTQETEPAIAAAHALAQLGALEPADLAALLESPDPDARVTALRLGDRFLAGGDDRWTRRVIELADRESHPRVRLQLALSLGESLGADAFAALVAVARQHGDTLWMPEAIASSLHRREAAAFVALASDPGPGRSLPVMAALSRAIGARGDATEWDAVLAALATAPTEVRASVLAALAEGRESAGSGPVLSPAGTDALAALAAVEGTVGEKARSLAAALREAGEPIATAAGGLKLPAIDPPSSEILATFTAALADPGREREPARGKRVFLQHCALCHRVGADGFDVGPDILGELGLGEEALLRQILIPGERIRPGFEAAVVERRTGGIMAGIMQDDGATSLTLILPGGQERRILRTDVESVQRLPRSLMPAVYAQLLSPEEAADLLAWLAAAATGR